MGRKSTINVNLSIQQMKVGNIFSNIPEILGQEVYDRLAASETVVIERIVSKGQETAWLDQDKHEWVMVLKGNATLMFADHSTVQVAAGDYIHIPAHTKHKVTWTNPDTETVWLAVHYL